MFPEEKNWRHYENGLSVEKQLDPFHFTNTETADLPIEPKCLARNYPVTILPPSTKALLCRREIDDSFLANCLYV